MDELLKSKDLMREPRVRDAYVELGCPWRPAGHALSDSGKKLYEIPGSLADVAFTMRDASHPIRYCKTMKAVYVRKENEEYLSNGYKGMDFWLIMDSEPGDWIVAATLAWEAKAK